MATSQGLDNEPRSTIRIKKKQRDRLIRLCDKHQSWVLGFMDEVWWSRLAQPHLSSWTDAQPLRLIKKDLKKDDPQPKALCCYGILCDDIDQVLLRFV